MTYIITHKTLHKNKYTHIIHIRITCRHEIVLTLVPDRCIYIFTLDIVKYTYQDPYKSTTDKKININAHSHIMKV